MDYGRVKELEDILKAHPQLQKLDVSPGDLDAIYDGYVVYCEDDKDRRPHPPKPGMDYIQGVCCLFPEMAEELRRLGQQSPVEAELNEANAIADTLLEQNADHQTTLRNLLADRRHAAELLAQLFDRFSCAKCGSDKSEGPCECGFYEVGQFLNRLDIAEDLDRMGDPL